MNPIIHASLDWSKTLYYIGQMKSGRINSKGSMKTASRVLKQFDGSWKAIDEAATRDENGVYIIRRRDDARPENSRQKAEAR